MSEYRPVLTGSALRTLHSVPPRVAEPLVAFIFGGLASDPRRRGKPLHSEPLHSEPLHSEPLHSEPLHSELEGRWSARRGDYRVVYRLDEQTKTLYVLRIAHRADAYRSG